MQIFIEPNGFLNKATDTLKLAERAPGYADALDAVAEVRQQHRLLGTQGWSGDRQWKHVASIYGPVLQVAECLDPDFLNGNCKRDFYRWLDQDQNKKYVTYDRRRNAKRSDLVTFVNGKEV